MKQIVLIGLFFISASATAQIEIKIDDVSGHIGDSVKIKAKIISGRYALNAKGAPTFLNVGAEYPNALLTLVIWEDTRDKFKEAPEILYAGRLVWITGKIIKYKNKPEIVITDPAQILQVIAAPIPK